MTKPPASREVGGFPRRRSERQRKPQLLLGATLLGAGLGGFVDGIVLHQILQWHHMLTDHPLGSPPTVDALELNTFWDGLFHAATWLLVATGVVLLVVRKVAGATLSFRAVISSAAVGWGLFNVIEGTVNHHMLTIHHVRDGVSNPLPWDLAFLLVGLALVVAGLAFASRNETASSK